ncbi:hypothetical protein GJ496_006272 [Pomphorhynchus laevis]|nr:hypothetical protein GJ496_006272 [Pomphorhynchus laevis]
MTLTQQQGDQDLAAVSRFVKLDVKLVTPQSQNDGLFNQTEGILIITPSVIMFNGDGTKDIWIVAELNQLNSICAVDRVPDISGTIIYVNAIDHNSSFYLLVDDSHVDKITSFLLSDCIDRLSFADQTSTRQMLSLPFAQFHLRRLLIPRLSIDHKLICIFKEPRSQILTNESWIRNLLTYIPVRFREEGSASLVFCTDTDGFSLMNLYRHAQKYEDGHNLILIQDSKHLIFGALISNSLHSRNSFYGTGESFLFSTNSNFKVYLWTGKNQLFVHSNETGIGVGASDGKYGLWINEDLRSGTSCCCSTYQNEILSGTRSSFQIARLELWSFMLLKDEQ